jgi:hypothetical protein
LLDQIDLRKLIELHITKTKNHEHIDEVLIEDYRHVHEAYNLGFIYKRLRWYWGIFRSIKDVLKLIDVKMYLILLPLAIILTAILAITLSSKLLLTLISLYLILLAITEVLAYGSHRDPLIELIISAIWLPACFIVKSILAYVVIVSTIKIRYRSN